MHIREVSAESGHPNNQALIVLGVHLCIFQHRIVNNIPLHMMNSQIHECLQIRDKLRAVVSFQELGLPPLVEQVVEGQHRLYFRHGLQHRRRAFLVRARCRRYRAVRKYISGLPAVRCCACQSAEGEVAGAPAPVRLNIKAVNGLLKNKLVENIATVRKKRYRGDKNVNLYWSLTEVGNEVALTLLEWFNEGIKEKPK